LDQPSPERLWLGKQDNRIKAVDAYITIISGDWDAAVKSVRS